MNLTKDFTLAEMTKTKKKMSNIPNETQIQNLIALCTNVLQPSRDELGFKLFISSGFRSPGVNAATGGASTSQHLKGEAADVICADNAKLFNYIKDNLLFDQLIWEYGNDKQPAWVHVSYSTTRARKMILRATTIKGVRIYKKIQ